jgi:hypothetical protein
MLNLYGDGYEGYFTSPSSKKPKVFGRSQTLDVVDNTDVFCSPTPALQAGGTGLQ